MLDARGLLRSSVPMAAAAVSFIGCAQLVGIGDWEATRGPTTGAGGASATTATASVSASATSTASSSGTADPTCADGRKDGLETDVDCGGDSCRPCGLGKTCANGADCSSGNCATGVCNPPLTMKVCPTSPDPGSPTCADCVKNGLETDIDCGGDACPPCAQGQACNVASDCVTGNCDPQSHSCGPKSTPGCPPPNPPDPLNPTCADCVRNGAETDVDCGGDSCPPCKDGLACLINADCKGGLCDGGFCATAHPTCPMSPDPTNPTCADCVKNGAETDVDCGGDSCPRCATGKTCASDTDCLSGHCQTHVCG